MTAPDAHRGLSATVLLSGGIDSATVAMFLLKEGWHADAFFVDYGQLPVQEERSASRRIAAALDLPWSEVRIQGLEIPSFAEVRGRNDLLIAVACARSPATAIAIGTHGGTPYADCSPAHGAAWQALLDTQHFGARRFLDPLRDLSKLQVIALAKDLDVPLAVTYSCEAADGPCGTCLSCTDRENAIVRA